MSMAPRLDLRHSQSLVMTPQLRQAIKLLQSSNLEVTAFVEEELERNPLLERDERVLAGPDDGHRVDPLPALAEATDSHAAAASDSLPAEGAAPLDADWSNVYDQGGGYEFAARQGRPHGFRRRPLGHRRPCRRGPYPARASRRTGPADLRRPAGPADRRADPGPGRCRRAAAGGGCPPRRRHGLRGGTRHRGPPADAAVRPGRDVLPQPVRMPGGATGRAQPARPRHAGTARQPRDAGAAGPGAG